MHPPRLRKPKECDRDLVRLHAPHGDPRRSPARRRGTVSSGRVMSVWARRHDRTGQTTFVSYSRGAIEMLLPPGSAVADRQRDAQLVGATPADGLWTWATWPKTDETIVGVDPPERMEPLRTFDVLGVVGPGLHGDVHELMREQLRHAAALAVPEAVRGVDERRAHEHAPLLMALAGEFQQAFPGVEIWEHADLTAGSADEWDRLLGDEERRDAPHVRDSIAALTGDVISAAWALARALGGRLRPSTTPRAAGTSAGQGPKRSRDTHEHASGPLAAKP